jgi:hypothetical protein
MSESASGSKEGEANVPTPAATKSSSAPKEEGSELPPPIEIEKGHPGLTALDLANLALRLDPDRCRSNPKEAFKKALEFYQHACFWVDEHASQDPLWILLDASNEALLDEALRGIGKKNLEDAATKRLRFYPKNAAADDQVRQFLRLKKPRAVKDRFRKWYGVLHKLKYGEQPAEVVLEDFSRFWENARHCDENGTEYYEFPPSIVEGIKSLQTQIKKKGGLKSVHTALSADQTAHGRHERAQTRRLRTHSKRSRGKFQRKKR